jgi:hypothetical protein
MRLTVNCLQLLIIGQWPSLLRLKQVLVHGIEHIQVADILRVVIGDARQRMHELEWYLQCPVILPAQ